MAEEIRIRTAEAACEKVLKIEDLEKGIKSGKLVNKLLYVPEELYHAGPGVSRSGIAKIIEKSAMHYQDQKMNPTVPTVDMIFGTRFHKIILEREGFFEKYMLSPNFSEMFGPMQSPKNRAKRDEYILANKKEPIEQKDWDRLNGMMDSWSDSSLVQAILKDGISEPSVYWYSDGVLKKARADYLRDDGIVIDVKSAHTATGSEFQRAVVNYRYDLQENWYLEGFSEVLGKKLDQFIFLVGEKTRPFAVAEFVLDKKWKDISQMDLDRGIDIYKRCEKEGKWPGYPQEIQNIPVPGWFANQY